MAELRDPTNQAVAQLVGRTEAQFIQINDLISRVIVQTSRSAGLSTVYLELLTFAGNEIYFTREPSLIGTRFGAALATYEQCVLIGLFTAAGEICLRPSMHRLIDPADQLIVIAPDERKIRRSEQPPPPIEAQWLRPVSERLRIPERTLILSWNDQGPLVIHRLEGYVPPGSTLDVVADRPDLAAQVARVCPILSRQTITYHQAVTTDRTVLELLPLDTYDHVIHQPLSFYVLSEAAQQRGEIALGYWVRAETEHDHLHYGLHLNPTKAHPVSFAPEDQVIILTSDQWQEPMPL
ncbi:MAG: CASTOR/POLLUX-related putative ion channel [Oscillochloridaceae bacterium umkhey_bin13]